MNKAGQTRDWNSLECQELALREEGAEKIFSEKFSGIKDNRFEVNKLLKKIKSGDTLIIIK
ncbi:MAG: recombinase family protein [Synergistaceae bacterium]|nr:recombinase family protein [Synergistaceae bacterium]MBR0075666.1 recombinase family protein [Synergistaceae bacterium]MBR0315348.1 recombinase family protein [Synergistaceae bacterium]